MGRISRRRKEAEKLSADISELRERLTAIGTRLDEIVLSASKEAARLNEVASKSSDFDARISQIGTEVTHQLGELSSDLERLAQEQARYQIAFRQDLAEVADMAKKKTS